MSSPQKRVQQWHPPFTRQSATPHHPLWLMQTLGQAKGGFYPIGKNGLLHGGVHFDQKTADYLHQHEVRALADGEVVAWRLDDQYPSTLVDGNNKVFSRSFVLLRHPLEAPVIEGAGTPPKLTFYSLYMHLKSWVACQADKSALPHWQTQAIYQIKPDDSIEGLRVRSQPKGQVLGLLPRGCQVELEPLVEGETTNGWRRLKQVLDGQILPAALPESTTGWVFAGELDLETDNTYRVGTRARDQEDALMKGKGLNLRDLNQDPKNNIVGMIPQGVRFTLGEPVGQYRAITGFETGEGQPWLPSHYTGHSVHSSYLQALDPQPLQLNEVHLPEQPIPVQAGEVIGWVGQYQNLNEATPHPLMQLDVFTQDDLPGFIEQSRIWAAKLPESHQTLLKIQKDQSRIVPYAGPGMPPEINQAIPAPASLLLNRQQLNRLPASHQQWDSDNKGHWWLLENSLPAGSDDSTPASYWIHESLSELQPLTPWHWDGQDCLEESQQPLHYLLSQLNGLLDRSTQDLGRLLNSRSWLGNALNTALSMLPAGIPRTLRNVFEQSHPLKHYVSQLDETQQGSLQTRLQTLLDENGDGLLSPQEIQQAQQKPWQQQPLAGLAIKMDSEWKWNKAKWDSLDGLANHTVNCPNTPWAAQKERIEQLSWWDEVAAKSDRLGAEANVWHMHPIQLMSQFMRHTGAGEDIFSILRQKLKQFETPVHHMYRDSRGFITVGIGHLLFDVSSALKLEFLTSTGERATEDQIRQEYNRLKKLPDGAPQEPHDFFKGYAAGWYVRHASLRISDETMEKQLDAHIVNFTDGLRRGYLTPHALAERDPVDFDDLPNKVKLATYDLIFNVGAEGFFGNDEIEDDGTRLKAGFHRFNRHISNGNWEAAANESRRTQVSKERNQYVRELLLGAARGE